jgi:hypothetical protein
MVCFITIWHILRPIWYILHMVIWYILSRFGKLYQQKSGSPAPRMNDRKKKENISLHAQLAVCALH